MAHMAEEQHTGGMIALVPSDARALAITDGEPADEIHLTLAYLGDDVGDWSDRQRDAVHTVAHAFADVHSPIEARIFGHAKFNPDGGVDGDMEPCLVYLVGDAWEVADGRATVLARLREEIGEALVPRQHEPFVPHITAAYGRNLEYGLFTTGPVTFDRVRVALGDDVTDYPLGGGEMQVESVDPDGVDAWFESKVMSPDPRAAELRSYWVGQFGKKWRKWRELHRHLKKYVKNPNILDGLTTNIYRLATGHMPPRAKKSAEGLLTEFEIKAAMALADPDAADFDADLLAEWMDDDEDEDEPADDDADALFEQSLIDAVDWDINAEGGLERTEDEDDGYDDPDGEEPTGPRTPMGMGPSLFDLYGE